MTNFNQTGTYNYTDPTTGSVYALPQFTESTQLSPLGQSILTGQQTIANTAIPTAETLANRAATSATTPLNFSTPQSAILDQTPQASPISSVATPGAINPQQFDQNAANGLFSEEETFLRPQQQQQQKDLQDQLSRQGISVGNDAYSNAEAQLENTQNQQTQAAAGAATAEGAQVGTQQAALGVQQNQNMFGQNLANEQNLFGQNTENQQNMFNLALAGQQQNLSEQQLAQSNPISLLQQVLGASPSTPTQPVVSPVPTSVSPTDVVGSTAVSTNAAMQAYQAQIAQQNAMFGGLASLGGAGIMALAL